MLGLKILITIANREYEEAFFEFFKKKGVSNIYSTLCNGTANTKMLDLLGIEKTDKVMLYSAITSEETPFILRDLLYDMRLDITGSGIAFTIPVDSIGGKSSLRVLTGNETVTSEVVNMETKFVLIVAITEKGATDVIMDAAKSAGAKGGTVLHGKGTATEETRKFFGVSIAAEKEIVYIVSKISDRDGIMHAIMDKAGMNTEYHTVVFSLPVDSVAGLRNLSDN